jgi:hypothetical protein
MVNCSLGLFPPRFSENSFPAPPAPFPIGRKPIPEPGRIAIHLHFHTESMITRQVQWERWLVSSLILNIAFDIKTI